MNRRPFLALCAAGLSGIAGCGAGSQPTASRSPTTKPGTSPSSIDAPPLDGSWRSYQHDAANTGATDDPGPSHEPTELWSRTTATGAPATAPAAADGTVAVVTDTGVLYARDAADGAIRWSRSLRASTTVPPVATADTVVVADDRALLGIDAETGDDRWMVPIAGEALGLALAEDGVVVATASEMRAVALGDGTTRWRREPDGTVVTPPGVGDVVAVGLAGGDVAAFETSTGRRRWRSADAVAADPAFAPAVGDDRVYVAAESRLVALDGSSGDERWDRTTDARIATSPAVTADVVAVTTLDDDVAPPETRGSETGATRTSPPTDTRWFAARVLSLFPDGSERWRATATETYNFTSGPPGRVPLVVAGDTLVVGLGGTLRAYATATGDRRWSASGGGVSPAVTEGVVSTGAAGVDLETGSVRWRFGTTTGVAPPAVVDNTVYAGSDDTYLYALAANTGAIRWSARTDGRVRATPTVGEDAVYVGTATGTLYAFDRTDGAERWTFDVGGQVQSPALADGTLYVGNFSPTVTAVDAADGSGAWRTRVDSEGAQFVALDVAVGGNAVYAGANGDLRAFDTDDGAERWRATADERPVVQSPPVVSDGRVLVTMGDAVRAFDPADGAERWAGSIGGSNRPPVVHDGTVYASGGDGVAAFDVDDGTELWRTDAGGDLLVTAGDEAVYALGVDASLRALDPSDGETLWRREGVGSPTPPAVADEHLFVGDATGRLHALGPAPGGT